MANETDEKKMIVTRISTNSNPPPTGCVEFDDSMFRPVKQNEPTANDYALAAAGELYRLKSEVARLEDRVNCLTDERTLYFRWAYMAVLALAIERLRVANENLEDPNNWPAGQEWHQMNGSSHSIFLREARKLAGIPNDEFLAVVRGSVIDVDDIYEAALQEKDR